MAKQKGIFWLYTGYARPSNGWVSQAPHQPTQYHLMSKLRRYFKHLNTQTPNTKKVSRSPPFLLSTVIQTILTQPSTRITEHTHPRAVLVPRFWFPAMIIRT